MEAAFVSHLSSICSFGVGSMILKWNLSLWAVLCMMKVLCERGPIIEPQHLDRYFWKRSRSNLANGSLNYII